MPQSPEPDGAPDASAQRHVFVYGTLRRGGRNDIARYRPMPVHVADASIAATLYDLGAYPGAVLGGQRRVVGEIYRVAPQVEAELDRLEGVADNGSGGYYGYRAAKAAVNAIGKSLAIDLRPRGSAVVLLHPGYVATEMVGGSGDVTPAQAANQLVTRLDALTLDHSGSFWHANGSALPW